MRFFDRRFLAISITCLIGWLLTIFSTHYLEEYALGLFVMLPMILGFVATVIYGSDNSSRSIKQLRHTSFLALLFYTLGLIIFAIEGLICIAMAAPIGIAFTFIGHLIGSAFIRTNIDRKPLILIGIILTVPAVMSFESGNKKETIYIVQTSVEINAAAEEVWKELIAFSQIDPPNELLFKAGIAYPINAKIEGRGVGAVRHCNFSTGSFVEPITVWNEPNLLAFDVVAQPVPLKEISLYNIDPGHLHGYWLSKKGQFRLKRLPGNKTLLEGTTWYTNKIKPEFYWNIWGNHIVHKIHERVLNHIKKESER